MCNENVTKVIVANCAGFNSERIVINGQRRPESHLGLRSRLDLAPKRRESRLSHHLMTRPDLKFS